MSFTHQSPFLTYMPGDYFKHKKNKQMKQFNFEKAMQGVKVLTRDGRPVKICGYNANAASVYRIAGWVGEKGNFWTVEGKYLHSSECDEDIFTVEEGYINIHMDNIGVWVDEKVYYTEDEAKSFGTLNNNYFRTNKIEI